MVGIIAESILQRSEVRVPSAAKAALILWRIGTAEALL